MNNQANSTDRRAAIASVLERRIRHTHNWLKAAYFAAIYNLAFAYNRRTLLWQCSDEEHQGPVYSFSNPDTGKGYLLMKRGLRKNLINTGK